MNKKEAIIAGVVIVVAAIVIILFGPWSRNNGANDASNAGTNASGGIVVPQKGAATSSVPANVAIPQVQSVTNIGGGTSYRSFSITADNNMFTPSTIIVNKGDTINILITAQDKNYDFTQPDYGFNDILIKKGTTKQIQLEATAAGTFSFYCSSCGGPSAGPMGSIVIAPQ